MTEPSASTPGAASLAELLRSGRFAITAEVTPLVSCDRDDLMQKALPLRNVADAVNLTDGAGAAGVRNLLILTGDDPKAGDQPEAKPVFDLDTVALTQLARAIRDRGELPHGRKVAGKAHFFIGAADAPIDPPPDWQPTRLAAKV